MELEISRLATKKEIFSEGFKEAEKSAIIAASFAVIKKYTGSLHKELIGDIPL